MLDSAAPTEVFHESIVSMCLMGISQVKRAGELQESAQIYRAQVLKGREDSDPKTDTMSLQKGPLQPGKGGQRVCSMTIPFRSRICAEQWKLRALVQASSVFGMYMALIIEPESLT